MKKRNNRGLEYLVVLLGAILFTACHSSKRDKYAPEESSYGNTFVQLAFTVSDRAGGSTRVVDDDQRDQDAREAESKLFHLQLVGDHIAEWNLGTTPDVAGTFWRDPSAQNLPTYISYPVNVGSSRLKALVAVVANNKETQIPQAQMSQDYIFGSSDTHIEDMKQITSPTNGFLMSSAYKRIDITPKVSLEAAKAATPNRFSFDLERVASQGVVAKNPQLKAETKDGKGRILLDNLSYAAVNGATKVYLFRNHGGESNKIDNTSKQYKDFKSAIDDFASDDYGALKESSAAKEHLVRLGNYKDNLGGYARKPVLNSVQNFTDNNGTDGIYFLENSASQLGFNRDNKDFGFYRMAYAKIYATFIPNKVLALPANAKIEIKEQAGAGLWYKHDGSANFAEANYDVKRAAEPGYTEGFLYTKELLVEQDWSAKTTGTTFYLGDPSSIVSLGDKAPSMGAFYDSLLAAQSDPRYLGQKVYTFTDGKCAYRALWNRQVERKNETIDHVYRGRDPKLVESQEILINANTRRNNIYLLEINSFTAVGMPWDASDPDDPYLTKPVTLQEGSRPDDPNIEAQDSHIQISLLINPWDVYSRKILLH